MAREQKRPFSTWSGATTTTGDPEAAAVLAEAFARDPSLDRALTHGFHAYAGRIPASLCRRVIARWSAPGDRVLDPFCGSGTVLVEARALGRAAVGIDLSPLATRLSRVRTDVLTPADRQRLAEEARAIAEESSRAAKAGLRPPLPPWAPPEFRRFAPHVALELFTIRDLVLRRPEDGVGLALRLCLSSILVKLLAGAGGEDRPPRAFGRGFPSRHFADRAGELARGLHDLALGTPPGTPEPLVLEGDAVAPPPAAGGDFALVLTSPPYPGVYDYEGLHDVRFRWLDLPRADLRRGQIGRRAPSAAGATPAFAEARERWLRAIGRKLRPGGHAAIVTGDGVVDARPEDALEALIAATAETGLERIAAASAERPPHHAALRRIFRGRSRREHLVLFRRSAVGPV